MNWNLLPVAEYERLAPVWDEINEAAGALPFMQARFIGPLCQIFGHAGLQIALAESVNKPMAIGILARRGPHIFAEMDPSEGNLPSVAAPLGPPRPVSM